MAKVNWFLKIQVKFIKNQKFLRDLIIGHESLEAGFGVSIQEGLIDRELIFFLAIRNLHVEEFLAEIAKNVRCQIDLGRHTNYSTKVIYNIECLAVAKIQNQALLEDVAKNAGSGEVKIMALQKIESQDFLMSVIMGEAQGYIFPAEYNAIAVGNVTDQKLLAIIAKTCPHHEARCAAVKKITDGSVLYDLALNGIDEKLIETGYHNVQWIRVLAIENPNLSDIKLFELLSESGESNQLKYYAKERLKIRNS